MFNLLLIAIITLSLPASSAMADHWGKPKLRGAGPWKMNISVSTYNGTNPKINKKGNTLVKHAGVPNLVNLKGRPRVYFQWLPIQKSLHRNFDHIAFVDLTNGRWSPPKTVKIPFKTREQYPVDPTVVNLKNGNVRMYFTSVSKRGTYIGSAQSSDGINFSPEKGKRLAISNVDVRDSAVIFFGDKWHLISPSHKGDARGFYATSSNGLDFKRQTDVSLQVRGEWLGNMVKTNGKVYFYGTGFIASTKNFKNWSLVSKHKLQDPAVLILSDKTIIVSTTR